LDDQTVARGQRYEARQISAEVVVEVLWSRPRVADFSGLLPDAWAQVAAKALREA
jgi:hypothetical protein